MEIDENVAETAFAVVQEYFAALNSGNAEGVMAVFNYPHVRMRANGSVTYYADKSADHFGNFRKRTNADGWHESIIDNLQAILTAPTMAHVVCKFRRLRADGSVIGAYQSLYIVTQIDGHWGLQGGSGTG